MLLNFGSNTMTLISEVLMCDISEMQLSVISAKQVLSSTLSIYSFAQTYDGTAEVTNAASAIITSFIYYGAKVQNIFTAKICSKISITIYFMATIKCISVCMPKCFLRINEMVAGYLHRVLPSSSLYKACQGTTRRL